MKKYAGILNVLLVITFWIVLVAAVLLAGFAIYCMTKGGLSYLLDNLGTVVTIKGIEDLKNVDVKALKLPLIIVCVYAAVMLTLSLLEISNLRKSVKEVKAERPFSIESSNGLKTAGTLTMINGIIGVVVQLVVAFLLTRAVGKNMSTNITLNLSFIISAVIFFLLKEVADYGREHTI